jgi:bacillithiol biosynthesis cysteine-adding enzyme BshC
VGVNLEIRVRAVAGNRLVEDYVRGDRALAPFFPGHPFDPQSYIRKADEVRSRFDPDRLRAMAEAIRPNGPEARDRLQRIAAGEGFFVTTGQQPGLFGGPLYTVHKALSAVALTRRLESLLDVPVLPLYWIASDDHDWHEANHTYLLDTANELRRLVLHGDPDSNLSLGERRLDSGADTALSELSEILPASEFTPDVLDRIRAAYDGGTVASAFTRVLEDLLRDLSLGFVDAQDPVVRRLAGPVLRRELERTDDHEARLRRQTERLEAAGYETQVSIIAGASNVFYEDPEHGRERLLLEGGKWLLRASRRTLSDAELWSRFEESPGRFSANVVLRPVVESAVFPTVAYVGGPGEVRYLAQTGCLFDAHDVGMPLVFPRFSVTLVEAKVRKVLDKFGLTEEDLVGRPIHEVVSKVVRDDVPEEVQEAVGALRQALQEGYQAVFDAARQIDPTLKGPIFHARNEGFKAVSDVERKIRHHVKLREETELEQIEKAAANLAPEGRPQERVLNVHQYLARYGDELIPSILENMDVRLDADGEDWQGVDCD